MMRFDLWERGSALWWLLSALGVAVAFIFLRQSVFSEDDGHILQLVVDAPGWSVYLDPEVYQQLSMVHYTPVVLTVYGLLLTVFGLEPLAFVVTQLLLMGACMAMAAVWCHRQTGQASAGAMVLLLVIAMGSFWPMLSRFYTVHYVLGAVFCLGLLLLLQRPAERDAPWLWAGAGVLALGALLSKEVYALCVPALAAWCIWRGHSGRASALVLACVVYAGLRWHVMGMPFQGYADVGAVTYLGQLDIATILRFFRWYAQQHALLLAIAVWALWRNPGRMLAYATIAGVWALPALGAPHAIRDPAQHADRVFFAFNLALLCAVVLVLHQKPWAERQKKWCLAALLAVSAAWAQASWSAHAQQLAQSGTLSVTRQILAARPQGALTVLTDLNYQQGGLMRVMALQQGPQIIITQNCGLALALWQQGQALWVLDAQGRRSDPKDLPARCRLWPAQAPSPVVVKQAPRFVNGVLQWHLEAADGWQLGVEFPDRAMSFGMGQFHMRLVRPRDDEPYRLFAHRDGLWWFSDVRSMSLTNSRLGGFFHHSNRP
jgi:hypothetical protein